MACCHAWKCLNGKELGCAATPAGEKVRDLTIFCLVSLLVAYQHLRVHNIQVSAMTDPVLDSQSANTTGEMNGLCPELLLVPPPLSNPEILEPIQSPCPSGNSTPLPADPGCLLVEATATEEDTGNMEIIVEAVAGNLSPSAPGETSGPEEPLQDSPGHSWHLLLPRVWLCVLR